MAQHSGVAKEIDALGHHLSMLQWCRKKSGWKAANMTVDIGKPTAARRHAVRQAAEAQ